MSTFRERCRDPKDWKQLGTACRFSDEIMYGNKPWDMMKFVMFALEKQVNDLLLHAAPDKHGELNFFVKTLGSAGTVDPVNQYGTIGAKLFWKREEGEAAYTPSPHCDNDDCYLCGKQLSLPFEEKEWTPFVAQPHSSSDS